MRKYLLIVIVVFLCSLHAWPQTKQQGQIKGLITDKDTQQPLADATVALLHAKDSSRVVSGFTDQQGFFVLNKVQAGNYKLYITYLGYQAILCTVAITEKDTLVDLGVLPMQRTGVTLKMVEIVRIRPPMVIKKDTIEFNPEYYKTPENAVIEALLKKLPGIQIEMDGTIKVNGETVKKVLIDGKPFFGDDPTLATRNLPADMIDKVQLIDRKPDQAQFTGIDDGKREKVINITVKKDRKGIFFGRASAGYGTDERFAANGSLNRFSDGEQLSFLGSANNVNNPAFLDRGGQGMGIGGNGITRNWNGGVNYSKDLSKKLNIGGSYVVNGNRTENEFSSARQNLLPDTTYYYNQQALSLDNNVNHALNIVALYTIDTLHTLAASIKFNDASSNNLQENRYESLGGKRQLVNSGTMSNTATSSAPNFYAGVCLEKKFRKPGRTLFTSLNFTYDTNNQESFNRSHNLFIKPGGDTYADTIDQRNSISSRHQALLIAVTYTEPIFKDHFLEFNYTVTREHTISGKFTYDYNAFKKVYDHLNDSLSNTFENVTSQQSIGINLRAQKIKYDYSIGLYLQPYNLDNNNISRHSHLQQHAINFSPVVLFNYAFTNNNRLLFNYSGSTQQPGVNQLQPVPDNSNPLYIQLGNPGLHPAFIHNISIGYNALNRQTMRSFSANVNTTFTTNKIINANWLDSLGRQVSQPLNVNGAYNIVANIANSFPLKKQQTSINANTTFNFNRDISYINGIKGNTRNFNITQNLSFNYNYQELFDGAMAAGVNYNGMRYSIQKDNNANYFNYTFSLNGNVNLPLGFIIGGSLDYVLNTGRAAGYNQDATLVNAAISKSALRRKQGLIKVQGFDLLNRNVSVSRNVGESYIEDVQTKVLQRFFMISFSYFLKPGSKK